MENHAILCMAKSKIILNKGGVMREALIVLDAQQVYTDKQSEMYCKDASRTIEKINELIQQMASRKQLVVLVRHIHRPDGSDIGRLFDYSGEAEEDFNFKEGSAEVEFDKRLVRPSNVLELRKTRYSAFQKTILDNILKDNRIQRVIICGFMTNFCCESTAREALDRDYYVDFVIDATGTPGTDNLTQNQIRKVVSELMGAGFARVMTARKIISLWQKA